MNSPRNNPRFWIGLVTGIPMCIMVWWLAVLILTNSVHHYPTGLVVAVYILGAIFIGSGLWPKKK